MFTWILAGLLVLLQVPDVLTTNAILAAGGRELNPVVRLCFLLGPLWWLPKAVLATGCAWFIAASGDSLAAPTLVVLNVVYVLVVLSNLRQIRRLERYHASRAALALARS